MVWFYSLGKVRHGQGDTAFRTLGICVDDSGHLQENHAGCCVRPLTAIWGGLAKFCLSCHWNARKQNIYAIASAGILSLPREQAFCLPTGTSNPTEVLT